MEDPLIASDVVNEPPVDGVSIDVLLVEDDAMIARLIMKLLGHEGLSATLASHGDEAVKILKDHRFRLLILDRMLPGARGMDILRWVRSEGRHAHMAVLMVTALGDTEERVHGLREGADDYLAKPFDPEELVARIHALLRRKALAEDATSMALRDIQMNENALELVAKGKRITLRPLEFRLFQTLFEKPGKVRSREYLLDHVWGVNAYVEVRTVDVTVKRLRLALKEFGMERRIQTIRGAGYRYIEVEAS
ncbi:MAG: response regulator [Zetaproteobacteria bacterium]|nr:response regulator [Zetaproteobacteria bacterium]